MTNAQSKMEPTKGDLLEAFAKRLYHNGEDADLIWGKDIYFEYTENDVGITFYLRYYYQDEDSDSDSENEYGNCGNWATVEYSNFSIPKTKL